MRGRGKITVLVIDDDPGVLETVSRMLAQDGVHVLAALSGKNALEIYRTARDRVDVIIADELLKKIANVLPAGVRAWRSNS